MERGSDASLVDLVAAGAVVAAIAVLVVCQGGYYSTAACVVGACVGVVAAAFAVLRTRSGGERLSVGMLLLPMAFLAVAIAYAASGIANGPSLGSLAEAASWFAVTGLALLSAQLSTRAKDAALRGLCWVIVAAGAIGLLVCSQSLPLPGAYSDGRLQFTFQYANAAGAFFAAGTALCFAAGSHDVRRYASLPVTAALLTQSAGSLIVLAVGAAALIALFVRAGERDRLAILLSQIAVAVVASAACLIVDKPSAFVVALMALVAYGWACSRSGGVVAPLAVSAAVLAVAVVVVVALLVVSGRAFEASQTFVERCIQILDAAWLTASSPVLGVGPDAWRDLYPYVQNAQYASSVVHCGFAQTAVDAGLIGLAALVAAIAIGMARLVRARRWGELIVAGMLVMHAAVDFDWAFAALAMMLALVLTTPDGAREGPDAAPRFAGGTRAGAFATVGIACASAVVVLACVAGLALDREHDVFAGFADELAAEGSMEEPEAQTPAASSVRDALDDQAEDVVSAFQGSALAQRDADAQTAYLAALSRRGDYEEVARYADEHGVRSFAQALIVAGALQAQGDVDAAADAIVTELEREPFNLVLFEDAARYFKKNGLPSSVETEYFAAVDEANRRAKDWPASLLSNQEPVATIEDVS